MTRTDEYNGWANRETWALNLHITNDQGWYEEVREIVRTALEAQGPADVDKHFVGSLIEEHTEGLFLEGEGLDDIVAFLPVIHDVGSLWRISYAEIGQHFLADALEDIEHGSEGDGCICGHWSYEYSSTNPYDDEQYTLEYLEHVAEWSA